MKREEIEKIVNEILISEIEIDEDRLKGNVSLKNNLSIDSLSLVDLVAFLEKAFLIRIKLYEIDGVDTLNHLYDFLEFKIQEKINNKGAR